ncbi:GntR family transcriptional regulator [Rhodoglobus aureus]|uniref:GntR family transcriptional regulator n=1 Tax=Rhodoglobus aureus TaxID=191497 RepID=A0ABP4GGB5_9MICO
MPQGPVLPIEREGVSLRQMVVDRIRDLILYGTLEPGQKLVERDLCGTLGVSRTLLREALQQLQAQGLISNVLHRGPSVAIITEQDARDIYVVRELLEASAGRGFTLNATDEQIDELDRNVQALRSLEVKSDPYALLTAKNTFYETLLKGCGNAVIAQVLTQLNNRTTILRRMSLAQPGRLPETIEELEEVVVAVRAREADHVAELLAAHVARAATVAFAGFIQNDPDAVPASA